jgi:hypothetical protein
LDRLRKAQNVSKYLPAWEAKWIPSIHISTVSALHHLALALGMQIEMGFSHISQKFWDKKLKWQLKL